MGSIQFRNFFMGVLKNGLSFAATCVRQKIKGVVIVGVFVCVCCCVVARDVYTGDASILFSFMFLYSFSSTFHLFHRSTFLEPRFL